MRPRRIFRGTLTIMSLMICVAFVGLWVRSYRVADAFQTEFELRDTNPEMLFADDGTPIESGTLTDSTLAVARGVIAFTRSKRTWDVRPTFEGETWETRPDPSAFEMWSLWTRTGVIPDWWHTRGFAIAGLSFARSRLPDPDFCWGVSVPLWLIVTIFAAAPLRTIVRWIIKMRERARAGRSPHACATCGYDLRATPHRCPECGSARAADVDSLSVARPTTD